MKKPLSFIAIASFACMTLLLSCTKDSTELPLTDSESEQGLSKNMTLDIENSTEPTCEELFAYGQQAGCSLGKLNRIDIFRSTIQNPSFPECYKEGVRTGWFNCFKPSGSQAGTTFSIQTTCETYPVLEVRFNPTTGRDGIFVNQRTTCSTTPIIR